MGKNKDKKGKKEGKEGQGGEEGRGPEAYDPRAAEGRRGHPDAH